MGEGVERLLTMDEALLLLLCFMYLCEGFELLEFKFLLSSSTGEHNRIGLCATAGVRNALPMSSV